MLRDEIYVIFSTVALDNEEMIKQESSKTRKESNIHVDELTNQNKPTENYLTVLWSKFKHIQSSIHKSTPQIRKDTTSSHCSTVSLLRACLIVYLTQGISSTLLSYKKTCETFIYLPWVCFLDGLLSLVVGFLIAGFAHINKRQLPEKLKSKTTELCANVLIFVHAVILCVLLLSLLVEYHKSSDDNGRHCDGIVTFLAKENIVSGVLQVFMLKLIIAW